MPSSPPSDILKTKTIRLTIFFSTRNRPVLPIKKKKKRIIKRIEPVSDKNRDFPFFAVLKKNPIPFSVK